MTRVALITGGARGLGRALALDFARDHRVAILWHTTAPQDMPDSILSLHGDLTEPATPACFVAEVIARLGRLDVIVNNAAQIGAMPKEPFDPASARAMLDVNLLAPAALLSAALPHLQPGAAIVNISSVNAVLPPRNAAIYGASKAGLNLWTRAMAKELGPRGIRVNAVAPGAIDLPEDPRPPESVAGFVKDTPLGRLATPSDITGAVRFLASEAAGFITGEVLTVSGGYRI